MGHGATANRKALIALVDECVALGNSCNSAVREVQAKHNDLAKQTRTDIETLTQRADAAGAWCAKTERSVDREARRLEQAQLESAAFTRMPFWQRLRWLVTGRWPRPLRHGEGIDAAVIGTPTTNPYKGIPRPAPFQSTLGPRVLL